MEQTINEPLVRLGAVVGQKRVHLFRCRRQTRQIERYPAEERGFVRLAGRGEPLLFQTRQNELVNRREGPPFVFDFRQWRSFRFDERPMRFPFRALRDPAPQQINLRVGEMLARLERRHAIILVGRRDALD